VKTYIVEFEAYIRSFAFIPIDAENEELALRKAKARARALRKGKGNASGFRIDWDKFQSCDVVKIEEDHDLPRSQCATTSE
jgi:hypothetical protein